MNSLEHQETMRPRDWGEIQRIYWKKMIFWRKKFPLPFPSLLVSWWILQALLWSLKILNTVFVYFHPKHLLIQILKINSRSPTPVSWSRGLMVNLPSTLKGVSSGKFFPCYRVLWAPQTLPQTLIFLKIIPFPVNKLPGIETHHRFTTT